MAGTVFDAGDQPFALVQCFDDELDDINVAFSLLLPRL